MTGRPIVTPLADLAGSFTCQRCGPTGPLLRLEKDQNVTCMTVDEKNKVNFKGDVTSLSDAALQAIQSLGYEWPTVSGPWEWTYKGKRLDDLRREIEDKAD